MNIQGFFFCKEEDMNIQYANIFYGNSLNNASLHKPDFN